MAKRNVSVGIILTARDFASKVLRGFRKQIGGARQGVSGMRVAVTALAAGIVGKGVKALFELGSMADETQSKFNAVFGESGASVQAFNDSFGVLAGLSRTTAQELSATTGAIAQGMGFAQDASAAFSQDIIQLAGDIASFNNQPTEEVLRRITAGIVGEREPLKRLGIVIRQVDVDQRALILSGKESIATLTQQEKATATLQLITEKAGVAIGDLVRTQDSMANQAKQISGLYTTLKETLGQVFVQAMELTGGLGNTRETLEKVTASLKENSDKWAAWGAFIIRIIQLVVNVLKNIIRVAFNIGQSLGDLGILIVAALNPFDGKSIDDAWDEFKQKQIQNLSDIGAAAVEVADALVAVALAGEQAAAVQRGEIELPTRPEAPGAAVTQGPDADTVRREQIAAEVKELSRQAETLSKKFKLGLIDEDEFEASLEAIFTGLQRLRDSGDLLESQLISVGEALQGLRQTAGEINEGRQGGGQIQLNLSLVQEFGLALDDMFNKAETVGEIMANIGTQFLQDFTGAIGEAFGAFVDGSKSAAAAFSGAMLGAVASVAGSMAQFFFAKSLGALADGIMGDPRGFAAAAKFGAAAAAMAAVSGSIGAVGRGGGGGAGAGQTGAEEAAERLRDTRGDAEITIIGGILDMSDPRQQDALSEALSDLTGRNVVIKGG